MFKYVHDTTYCLHCCRNNNLIGDITIFVYRLRTDGKLVEATEHLLFGKGLSVPIPIYVY